MREYDIQATISLRDTFIAETEQEALKHAKDSFLDFILNHPDDEDELKDYVVVEVMSSIALNKDGSSC